MTHVKWIGCAILLSLSSLYSTSGTADVLLIDSVRSADDRNLPRTGQLMADVRDSWGQPTQEFSAVGEPPITRWDYDGFSVYFEHDHVISSVLHEGEVMGSSN